MGQETACMRFPKERAPAAELMDDFESDTTLLSNTLRQFSTLNRYWTRVRPLFIKTIFRDIVERQEKEVHVLDLGCGGGDFARWACHFARKRNKTLRWTLMDHDPRVVLYTKEACRSFPEITVVQADWRTLQTTTLAPFDYAIAFHLFHHLSDEDIRACLRVLEHQVRYGILVNDLRRAPWLYYGYTLLATFFFRGSFALNDGKQSILNGFTRKEWDALFAGWERGMNGPAHFFAYHR